MWSDNETDIDYLNYSEVAEIICDMVTDPALMPLSLGVYGGWGVGKSSVLKLIERQLTARGDSIVIEFDAWLYQGYDEAKSAMMTVIAAELIEQSPETLKDRAFGLLKRVDKLRALGLGADVVMAGAGLPTLGLFSKVFGSLQDMYDGRADEGDVNTVKDGAKAARETAAGLIKSKEIKTPPEEITAFKKEFSDVIIGLDKQLVVFVDNLDRCLPQNAIRCLEAMRLFMSMPNTAFIVAADVDMIRNAVADQFKGASEKHVTDYLDKLIQFPVHVPRLGMREVLSFLCMLISTRAGVDAAKVEALREFLIIGIQGSWKDEQELLADKVVEIIGADPALADQIGMAFRIAPILAHSKSVAGNPRIIKRMMNVIRMRHATAKRRKMELDEAIITKLALFERCTDEQTFKSLLDLINQSDKGRPTIFAEAKNAGGSKSSLKLPEAWDKHADFVTNWLALEPTMIGVDLRPAVYLARETLPLQFKSKSLSAESKKAVIELLQLPTRTSRAGMAAIATIPRDEIPEVMTELISAMRQNSDWSKKRNDVNGPILLAREKQETATALAGFLEQLPNQAPWLRALLKDI
jgi:predicted KAP-like P-loop ATPase